MTLSGTQEPSKKLSSSESDLRQFELVKQLVDAPDGLKVYLGSARDTALADAYGTDKVVHVDRDTSAIDALRAGGYMGEALDYEVYADSLSGSDTISLLYSENSGLIPDRLLEKLVDGGLVLANDWHGSASDIQTKPGFELLGAVNEAGDKLFSADEAQDAFGMGEYAVGPGGCIIDDQQEIEAARNQLGWTIIGQEKNPDFVWVFRKAKQGEVI